MHNGKPFNLRGLIDYLLCYPRVRITGPSPNDPNDSTRDELFLRWDRGCLWFQPDGQGEPHHIPIGCKLKASAASEIGMEFDERGVTFQKFGRSIRVEYLQ